MAKKILLVDDSASVRQVAGIALRRAGYETVEAGNGKEALPFLDAGKLNLIISDGNMPQMNGFDVVTAIGLLTGSTGTTKGSGTNTGGAFGATPARPQGAAALEIENAQLPQAAPAGSFVALKGHLRLPVKGTVSNRFGTPRQEGSNWKGLFIRSQTGGEVKAVAGGRVVFAEWMRGFGNLLIVDHGDGYLSLYSNNESLYKQPGEPVRAGDVVAAVGATGGQDETGLYFELRHQGKPFDPLVWVR